MLALLQSQLCQAGEDPGSALTLDAWILRSIAELKWRQKYTAAMVAQAQPFSAPKYEVMQELNVDGHVN